MKSKDDIPLYIKTVGNKINIICNEENQIQKVIKNMTKPGNCVFEGYEEWDEGDDMKWIITFRLLDNYELNLNILNAMVLSFVFSMISIHFMMKWISNYTFTPFVVYRVLLGTILLLAIYFW